jgi:hypothetical protein
MGAIAPVRGDGFSLGTGRVGRKRSREDSDETQRVDYSSRYGLRAGWHGRARVRAGRAASPAQPGLLTHLWWTKIVATPPDRREPADPHLSGPGLPEPVAAAAGPGLLRDDGPSARGWLSSGGTRPHPGPAVSDLARHPARAAEPRQAPSGAAVAARHAEADSATHGRPAARHADAANAELGCGEARRGRQSARGNPTSTRRHGDHTEGHGVFLEGTIRAKNNSIRVEAPSGPFVLSIRQILSKCRTSVALRVISVPPC